VAINLPHPRDTQQHAGKQRPTTSPGVGHEACRLARAATPVADAPFADATPPRKPTAPCPAIHSCTANLSSARSPSARARAHAHTHIRRSAVAPGVDSPLLWCVRLGAMADPCGVHRAINRPHRLMQADVVCMSSRTSNSTRRCPSSGLCHQSLSASYT